MGIEDFIGVAEGLLGPLGEGRTGQFRMMEGLYREWNGKINVISRKDMDEFYLHHVLHSLAPALYMKSFLPGDFEAAAGCGSVLPGEAEAGSGCEAVITDGGLQCKAQAGNCGGNAGGENVGGGNAGRDGRPLSFLDLGTGGGFPGIPLAIVFPAARFTLCDSVGKKVRVAADVALRLGLRNVAAVNARAESLSEKFDYAVTRAVAPLEDILKWTRGRVRRGIFCLKGGDVAQETAEVMAKFRLRRGSVHVWNVDNLLKDSYFQGKYVIFIENFCK